MKFNNYKLIVMLAGLVILGSCKKMMDINKDPDRLPSSFNVYPQLLTNAQVSLGFEGGSDLYRYTALISQHMSGLASQPNQTYEYSRYNITGSDENNVWAQIFANTLSDLNLIIKQAGAAGSPHYAGVAKILKAYEYSLVIDTWGDVPYTQAHQLDLNTQPEYDDDAVIYPKLIALLTEAITDMNAATSVLSPGTNSVIYSNASFTTARANWIKLANTLKLRLLLHYSKIDPVACVSQITALVNTAGITFLASNADNFQVPFFNSPNQRNGIETFERNRPGYMYADRQMTDMMNLKNDPRRPFYFSLFPFDFVPFTVNTTAISSGNTLTFATGTGITNGMTVVGTGVPAYTIVTGVTPAGVVTVSDGTCGYALPSIASGTAITFRPEYRGVSASAPPCNANNSYSRIHTFLRGTASGGIAVPAPYTGTMAPFTYTGDKPQRMISFAEYNFIRAEAALMGAPGNAQQFFTDGITASMQEAGVSAPNIATYLAANGTLSGTTAQRLQQIIEEKYLASFGVSSEPWTDWRRTGYPVLVPPTNRLGSVPTVPRSLFYPQSEVDLNPNLPGQKSIDLQTRVFWDIP